MSKTRTYSASDYAGLVTPHVEFYYGYEKTWCPDHNHGPCPEDCDKAEWCFTADFGGEHIAIPVSNLSVEDKWNCQTCLLAGIAAILTKYCLAET